ncbi:MAG: 2-C-methyl-D-erythritol 4-phosphate cytidylyltransferase [Tenericutes bacterium]|nr:2-C-methyl-D-erythritol 4-phosphate cytidylyltransferase [Mycoplasmatota bacterium]
MYSVVIVAAGSGVRTGLGYNKIFYKIKDKNLIEYSVRKFVNDKEFTEIIIVVSKEDLKEVRNIFSNPKIKYVIGGSSRQKSVFNGLSLVNEEKVFIHDSARPNLSVEDIQKLKKSLVKNNAVILYTPVKDSIIKYNEDKLVEYLDRNSIALVQTPQVFNSVLIKKAHSLAIKSKKVYTDDASLFRNELNEKVVLIEGSEFNFKATTKSDLLLLEELL